MTSTAVGDLPCGSHQALTATQSAQSYLDTIESRTCLTPRTLIDAAAAAELGTPDTRAGAIVA
ncbi:MAG TPA: hypothetical protein VGT61_12315 [Thermomicrobiales bacterium]|nr:hypothetical protein [Thermomicrobiales bacterium]